MSSLKPSCIIGGANTAGRSKLDYYPTPPEVTYALLNFLVIPQSTQIWEPAAGEGHMVKALWHRGYKVIGTDIKDGQDFMTADPPPGTGFIVTNPPFSAAEAFIRRGWDTGLPFAFLLKSQFWHAARRVSLFEAATPTYVLPLTWRPDFCGKGAPLMDVIWSVWLDHTRSCTIYRPLRKEQTNA